MKKISVLIPCYNECLNVEPMAESVKKQFDSNTLSTYEWELIFIDNCSTDGTREKLECLCKNNNRIKAIFNARNFGGNDSTYYGMCQTDGDCTIVMASDFQDPPELIPIFIKEWENGHKIVAAVKNVSDENKLMYFIRSCYYRALKKMSSVDQLEHFNGCGLYDKSFINLLKSLDDSYPFLRGIVAQYGANRKDVYYKQSKRKTGKSHFNFFALYDIAMQGFTSYTKVGLRCATIFGFVFSVLNMLIAIIYFIAKLIWWNKFSLGTAPMLIGIFFTGSIQLFFLGLLGEYILGINTRVMHRPLVVEEKRINFDE